LTQPDSLDDAGASIAKLKENFEVISEFLESQSPSPLKNPGFQPDSADADEGEILVIERVWETKPLKLI